jgi:L-amino acid N-acyltransferase YncA
MTAGKSMQPGCQESTMSAAVRDAMRADLPSIVEIYNSSIPGRMATADTSAVSAESRQPWFDDHAPDHRPLWVATVDGIVAGWLSFQSFYGRVAYHATAEVSVYVAPSHQRQGIGRVLLARAIARGPALGLRTLLGFIFGHNGPSIALFQSFGFERWALLPRVAELDGVERDLIIVGRRIEDTDGTTDQHG